MRMRNDDKDARCEWALLADAFLSTVGNARIPAVLHLTSITRFPIHFDCFTTSFNHFTTS